MGETDFDGRVESEPLFSATYGWRRLRMNRFTSGSVKDGVGRFGRCGNLHSDCRDAEEAKDSGFRAKAG